jgi:HEAT repeat protein
MNNSDWMSGPSRSGPEHLPSATGQVSAGGEGATTGMKGLAPVNASRPGFGRIAAALLAGVAIGGIAVVALWMNFSATIDQAARDLDAARGGLGRTQADLGKASADLADANRQLQERQADLARLVADKQRVDADLAELTRQMEQTEAELRSAVGAYRGRTVNEWAVRLRSRNPGVSSRAAHALKTLGPAAKNAAPTLINILHREGRGEQERDSIDEAVEILAVIGRPAVPALIETLKSKDHNPSVRAVAALKKMGPEAEAAVPALFDALRQRRGVDRFPVQEALGRIGPAAVPALTAALKDKDGDVRLRAASALSRIGAGAKEAVPTLIEALNDKQIQHLAVEALGKIGPDAKAALPILSEKLKDPAVGPRRRVARALLRIDPGQKEALAVLIDALKDMTDKKGGTRWNAAQALGELGPAAREAVPALAQALKDSNHTVRYSAADALGNIGPEAAEAVPSLALALKDSDVFLVRPAAAKALGKIGPKAREAVPALIDALKDKQKNGRAAQALAEIGSKEAVPVLRDGVLKGHSTWVGPLVRIDPTAKDVVKDKLKDLRNNLKDPKNGDFIVRLAAELGPSDKDAVSALLELLRCHGWEHKEVRQSAVRTLVEMGVRNKAMAPALAEELDSANYYYRNARLEYQTKLVRVAHEIGPTAIEVLMEGKDPPKDVIRALGRFDVEGKSVPLLLDYLKHGEGDGYFLRVEKRRAAAQALAWIGPAAKAAAPALAEIMQNDPDQTLRIEAAIALGEIGPRHRTVLPALSAAFIVKHADESFWDKWAVANTGALPGLQIMGQAGVPVLLKVLKDPELAGRIEVVEALAAMGPSAVPHLIEALKDKDMAMRSAVCNALGDIGPEAKAAVPALLGVMKEDISSMIFASSALQRIDPQALRKKAGNP